MTDLRSSTVADVVNENPNAAAIFKKYDIDFCCKGKRLLTDACSAAGVEVDRLWQEIQNVSKQQGSSLRINAWSLSMICDYVVNNHHSYVRYMIPQIAAILEKVARVHGDRHSELLGIRENYQKLSAEMLQHMDKEEKVLFPAIKKAALQNDGIVDEVEGEHETAGALMAEIRKLSSGFTPPEDACTSYRVLFQLLEEFEDDLHQHVHLENNVLIPKALGALN